MKRNSIKLKLYAIHFSSKGEINVNDDKGVCYYPSDIHHLKGSVLMHESYYNELFGYDRQSTSHRNKRISVVKISRIEGKKTYSIYRKFYPVKTPVMKGIIALPYHDLLFLKDIHNSIIKEDVCIKKGCRFMFFLKHPDEVVSISFVVSIFSLLVALLSLIITVILL